MEQGTAEEERQSELVTKIENGQRKVSSDGEQGKKGEKRGQV